jgi:predicted alpha/beta hydrolase family esterase
MRLFVYYPQYYFSISIQKLFRVLLCYTKPILLEHLDNTGRVPLITITNNQNFSEDVLSILYIHGDEYTSRRQFCTELYRRVEHKFPSKKIEIHIPLYRSFPEHSIEDSLSDLAVVYKDLKKKKRKLWIIADSFGGCLAVQLATELSEIDCEGMILISPITNLYCEYPSFESVKDDCLYAIEAKKMIRSRINPDSIHSISIIPISIPIYIFVSKNELCRDDSRELYRINRHARLYEIPDAIHLFPLFWHIHEKGNRSLSKMVTLIN